MVPWSSLKIETDYLFKNIGHENSLKTWRYQVCTQIFPLFIMLKFFCDLKKTRQFWSKSEPTNLGLFLWKCPFCKNELKHFQLNISRTKYTIHYRSKYIFETALQEIIYCNVVLYVPPPNLVVDMFICKYCSAHSYETDT